MKARFSGVCRLCGGDFNRGDQVVPHHGDWIHRHCAPGADDE